MLRRKRNSKKKKQEKQKPHWGLLLGIVLVLGSLVAAFGGRERNAEEEIPALQVEQEQMAERWIGYVRLDSLVRLYRTVDPDRSRAKLRREHDSLFVERVPGFSAARFRLIYLNQRSAEDLRRQSELGIRVLPGREKGYALALREEDKVIYAKIPYELMGGLMNAMGDKTLKDTLRPLPRTQK